MEAMWSRGEARRRGPVYRSRVHHEAPVSRARFTGYALFRGPLAGRDKLTSCAYRPVTVQGRQVPSYQEGKKVLSSQEALLSSEMEGCVLSSCGWGGAPAVVLTTRPCPGTLLGLRTYRAGYAGRAYHVLLLERWSKRTTRPGTGTPDGQDRIGPDL